MVLQLPFCNVSPNANSNCFGVLVVLLLEGVGRLVNAIVTSIACFFSTKQHKQNNMQCFLH